MKRWLRCLCSSLFALVGLLMQPLATSATPATAPQANPAPTVIRIDPVKPVFVGQPFTVTGLIYRHVEGGDAGIPHRGVALYIEPLTSFNGVISKTMRLAIVYSDDEGRLKWTVHKFLFAGRYRLYYLFEGSRGLASAHATTELIVTGAMPVQLTVMPLVPTDPGEPVTVTVRLTNKARVPLANQRLFLRLPGATQQRKTNANGVAVFVVQKPLVTGTTLGQITYSGQNAYAPAKKSIQLMVHPRTATVLAFDPVGDKKHYVGDELAFAAHLKADGQPLLNRLVRFYLDGALRYGVRTDANGKAVLRLPRNLIAGTHTLSATFRGTKNLLASAGDTSIVLLPRPFEIRTVPPLPNVKLAVGQQHIQTDARGVARLLVAQSGPVWVTVLPYESLDPNVRAEFIRWSDEVISATRRINAINGGMLQIGFEVSYPIQPRFVEESSGRPVDTKRLSQIMLVNSLGEAVPITSGVQWLKVNRIVRHDNVLDARALTYQLRNVTVDGVNVVNEGQQRFKVRRNARWTMKLQMHDLSVVARDALFGFPIGSGVRVTYPMGQLQDVALDDLGRMRIESLSRGSYTVTLQGAFFIRNPTPVALSRSQNVDLPVISYLDISIVAVAGLGLAGLVLLLGRLRGLGLKERN